VRTGERAQGLTIEEQYCVLLAIGRAHITPKASAPPPNVRMLHQVIASWQKGTVPYISWPSVPYKTFSLCIFIYHVHILYADYATKH